MQRLRTRLRASASRGAPAALSLDFLSASGALDPRITFSRGSNATLTDSTGRLTYAPSNLATNSEAFDNAAWTKAVGGTGVATTVTANAGVAPDGTTTADQIVFNRGAGNTIADRSYVFQSPTVATGVSYISSIYLKAATAGDVGKQLSLRGVAGGGYTLVTLTNAWQRVSSVEVAGSTLGNIEIANRGTVTADNTVTALVWGAQLSPVTYQTTPGTYNSTTPKNLLGFTQEFDNAAWTKTNAFVQTNSARYSEAFDNAAWGITSGVTVTPNATTAPNGTTTADALAFTSTGYLYQAITGLPAILGVAYTYSVWLWSPTKSTISVRIANNLAGSDASFQSITLSNTPTRVTITRTFTSAGTAIDIGLDNRTTAGGDGVAGTIYAWGAQLVQGSVAGDYQRTDAAAAAVQYYAPDGTLTADLLAETTASTDHTIISTAVTVTGAAQCFSIYLKKGSGTTAPDWLQLTFGGTSTSFANFNLSNGTVGVVSGVTASIIDAGSGWFRCAVVVTPTAGSLSAQVAFTNNTNSATRRPSYTGVITSDVLIWGAQLSDSASLDPYVYNPAAAAASTAYYGPRFDYDPLTLAPKGLLIEEARTNLLLRSQEFESTWNLGFLTVSANATVAPDGTTSADTLVPSTTSNVHYAQQSITRTAGNYTYTFYAKSAGYNFVAIQIRDLAGTFKSAEFNVSTGVVVTSTSALSTAITAVGNGWYRCSFSFDAGTGVGTPNDAIFIGSSAGNWNTGFAGNGTSGVYVWGAQLEAGSFATSYIPTVASTVTRSADSVSMIGDNFKSWYNLNEGTLEVLTTVSRSTDNYGAATLFLDGSNFIAFYFGGTDRPRLLVRNANVFDVNVTIGVNQSSPYNQAAAFKAGSISAASNGVLFVNSVNKPIPAPTSLQIGFYPLLSSYINGHVQSLVYYNTLKSNDTLQTLTNPSTTPSLALNFISDTYTVGA